jgi:hypothetical protein
MMFECFRTFRLTQPIVGFKDGKLWGRIARRAVPLRQHAIVRDNMMNKWGR